MPPVTINERRPGERSAIFKPLPDDYTEQVQALSEAPGMVLDRWGKPIPKSADRELLSGAGGAPKTVQWGGILNHREIDDSPAWQGVSRWRTLTDMMNYPRISSLLGMTFDALMTSNFQIVPGPSGSERARELAEEHAAQLTLREGHLTWRDICWLGFLFLPKGCQFLVPDYVVVERTIARGAMRSRYGMAAISDREQSTIEGFLEGEGGPYTFGGILQRTFDGQRYIEDKISHERIVPFWNRREGANWFGTPMLRGISRSYRLADRIERDMATHFHRFGAGMVLLKETEQGAVSQPDYESSSALMRKIQSGHDTEAFQPWGTELTLFGDGSIISRADSMLAAIVHYKGEMGDAMMGQLIDVGRSTMGGRDLGGSLAGQMAVTLTSIAQYMASRFQLINNHLARLNGVSHEDCPRFTVGKIDLDHAQVLLEKVLGAKKDGTVTWTVDDEIYVRNKLGLPEIDRAKLLEIWEREAEAADAEESTEPDEPVIPPKGLRPAPEPLLPGQESSPPGPPQAAEDEDGQPALAASEARSRGGRRRAGAAPFRPRGSWITPDDITRARSLARHTRRVPNVAGAAGGRGADPVGGDRHPNPSGGGGAGGDTPGGEGPDSGGDGTVDRGNAR